MTRQLLGCVLSLAFLLTSVMATVDQPSAAQPSKTAAAALLPPQTAGVTQGAYQIIGRTDHVGQPPNRTLFPWGSRSEVRNTGGPISGWFPISPLNTAETGEGSASVAYNSWWQEYLVVWVREGATGGSYIYGQFVDSDGTLIGSRFLIPGFEGSSGAPDVAYNPARNEYLVVYDLTYSTGYGIYGMRLDAYGTPVGTHLGFASSATDRYREPAVAYATNSSAYLVVWQRDQGTTFKGIEARTLSGDGTTMGSILAITGVLVDVAPSAPDVAYTASLDECLVVWQQWYDNSYTDHDIKGQRIHMEGGAHLVTPPGNFVIHSTLYDEVAPAVGAISLPTGIGQYLVVCAFNWTGSGGWQAAGQLLTDAGGFGPWLAIGTSINFTPAVAGNNASQEYLVAWSFETPEGPDLRARTVTTLGNMGAIAQASPARSGSSPLAPAVASGFWGNYLVTCHDRYQTGYPVDVFGYLWGPRLFLPLVLRGG